MYFATELCTGKAGELLLWWCSSAGRKKSLCWKLLVFMVKSCCWMQGCIAATLLYCCSGLTVSATGKVHHTSCATTSCAGEAFMHQALGKNWTAELSDSLCDHRVLALPGLGPSKAMRKELLPLLTAAWTLPLATGRHGKGSCSHCALTLIKAFRAHTPGRIVANWLHF